MDTNCCFAPAGLNAFSGNVEDATNQTIDSCLSMIACSSSKKLFINCTRNALVSMSVKLLPSRTVVLEILEDVTPDARAREGMQRAQTFRFSPRPG